MNNQKQETTSKMFKINYKLLPVKAHYFFFMAAMGPILPFLNVFGKQLGISEVVMGSITAVLPLLFLISKPIFGLVIDYFRRQRKMVFITLICTMSTFYVLLYFIPQTGKPVTPEWPVQISNLHCEDLQQCSDADKDEELMCKVGMHKGFCNWHGDSSTNETINVLWMMTSSINGSGNQFVHCLNTNKTFCEILTKYSDSDSYNLTCFPNKTDPGNNCLYGTVMFWGFVLLMSLGTIGFNVANSVSDAICFDVLGTGNEMGYGRQRVWGTIGFGIAAFLAGSAIDWWSAGSSTKDYTPTFILILVFTCMDIFCCCHLQLPPIPRSENILRDLGKLLKQRHILIFLLFAVFAGIVDSFIIYFLFWYLEDLAQLTDNMGKIKLLEGLVVAAETLIGEVIFFSFSGKILKKIGYGHSLSLCFLSYAIRLGLIAIIPSPWWVLPIELFMQGPSYAMCYTTIVAYASAVSPPGASATMQGLVAGMDDGFGYAVGSLIGGILYRTVGGSIAFGMFASLALLCSIVHAILYHCYLRRKMVQVGTTQGLEYKSPADAVAATDVAVESKEVGST